MGQLLLVLLQQIVEVVVVMVNSIHNILDNYFTSLRDYGYVNNQITLKVLLAALIDDEYDNIIECKPEYTAVLNRLRVMLDNSSCIFTLSSNCRSSCGNH
jgi:hypothetical protein